MAKPEPIKQVQGSKIKPIKIDTPKSIKPLTPTAYDPARQVAGYERRFEAAGVSSDTRSAFEKFTNLPANQGNFFDLFELVDRGTRSIASFMDEVINQSDKLADTLKDSDKLREMSTASIAKYLGKKQAGDSSLEAGLSMVGEGAKTLGGAIVAPFERGYRGFTGEDRTSFSQVIANSLQYDDTNFVTDVLGFALEVKLDPLDVAFLSNGVAKTATVLSDVNTFRKFVAVGDNSATLLRNLGPAVATTAGELSDVVKLGRQATRLIAAGDTSAEVLAASSKYKKLFSEIMGNQSLYENPTMYKSLYNVMVGGVGKGAKRVTKIADNLAIRGLNIYDEVGGAADSYVKAKAGIAKMFSRLNSMTQETLNKVRKQIGLETLSKRKMTAKWQKEMSPILEDIASKYGKSVDEVFEEAVEYIEYFYVPRNSVGRIIEKTIGDQPLDDASAEIVRAVFRSSVFNNDVVLKNVADPDNLFLANFNKLKNKSAKDITAKSRETIVDTTKVAEEIKAGDELMDIVTSPKKTKPKPKAAISPGDELIQIVESPKKGVGAGTAPRWSGPQQAEMRALSRRIAQATTPEEYFQILEEAIKKGYVVDDTTKASQVIRDLATQKETFENAFNNRLFNAIYEEVDVDGMRGFKLKNKQLLEDTLKYAENQYQNFVKAGYLDAFEDFFNAGRFAENSDAEQVFRKVFGTGNRSASSIFADLPTNHPLFGKKFEDLFTLTDEGWVLIDSALNMEIADVVSFYDKFDDVIDAPRWITQEEQQTILAIQNSPYRDDLRKFGNEYAGLSQINDELFGTDFYSKLPEGYVRHHLNDDIPVKSRSKVPSSVRKADTSFTFTGNLNYFDSREYQMTIRESNRIGKFQARQILQNPKLSPEDRIFWESRAAQDLFSKSIADSVFDMIKYQPELASASRKFEKALIEAALNDENVIYIAAEGATNFGKQKIKVGSVTLDGYRAVEVGQVRKKLKGFSKYLNDPESFDLFLKKFLIDDAGKPIADGTLAMIDTNVFDIIGTDWNKATNALMEGFVSITSRFNNHFKKFKVLSLGMHMRNIVGNATNMMLAGMSMDDIYTFTRKGHRVLAQGPDVVTKALLEGVQTLSKSEREIYVFYLEFLKNNFDDAAIGLRGLEEIIQTVEKGARNQDRAFLLRKLDQLTEWNAGANVYVDSRYRMGMLMWAMDNPASYTSRGLSEAGDYVRQALFDPNDLTAVEKSLFKRIIPFYTFSKKNLAHQMRSLVERPGRYKQVMKGVDQTWDLAGINQEDVQQYKLEQLWVPIPIKTANGDYIALKVNLPMEELGELVANPAQKIFSSFAPFIRAPFELVQNSQLFTGRPIQDFKGQRSYTFQGVPVLENLPRWLDYGISQLGIDVPLAPVTSIVVAANKLLRGDTEGVMSEFLTGSLRSVFNVGDLDKDRKARAYDRLDELQDLVRYYRDRGTPVKTIPEIENENKRMRDLDVRIKIFEGK